MSLESWENFGGTEPVIKLWLKSKSSRVMASPSSLGSVPLKLLLPLEIRLPNQSFRTMSTCNSMSCGSFKKLTEIEIFGFRERTKLKRNNASQFIRS